LLTVPKEFTALRAASSPKDNQNRVFGVAAALFKANSALPIGELAESLKTELLRQGIPYDHVTVNEAINTLLTRQAAIDRRTPRSH
jgi:hypothetical protein